MSRSDEQLAIINYDPLWPHRFAKLAERLETTLGSIVHRVEHIGSTAVPGLAAKPIIDLDVVLISHTDVPEAIRRLASLGYGHEGDLGIPGREAFRWPLGETRHHLYVLGEGTAELQRHLAFRDALRADPALRDAYASLKRSLAAQHSNDRAAYNEAKSTFIEAIIERQ